MKFKPGDKIKILDENAIGVFLQYLHGNEVLVDIDGFEYTYHVDAVIPFDGKLNQALEDNGLPIGYDKKEVQYIRKRKVKPASYIREIDLHSEKLFDRTSFKNEPNILKFQLSVCVKELDAAINRGEQKIIFIHGVGDGILKESIISILKAYDKISWEDAPYKTYGHGATLVTFH